PYPRRPDLADLAGPRRRAIRMHELEVAVLLLHMQGAVLALDDISQMLGGAVPVVDLAPERPFDELALRIQQRLGMREDRPRSERPHDVVYRIGLHTPRHQGERRRVAVDQHRPESPEPLDVRAYRGRTDVLRREEE